jgi:peptide/nickel transport system substrate-binding protein
MATVLQSQGVELASQGEGELKNNGRKHAPIGRRSVLKGATALAGSAALGRVGFPEMASAQDASTLVIACPATPQGLDIEFDVSLGSIDTLGCIYDYLVSYEKIPDPNSPEVLREDTSVRTDKPYNIALVPKLAESWEQTDDGLKATFKLREGVKSNWGNELTAEDVKWTWDRKHLAKGQGIFQTAVLGLKSPDQVKIEGKYAISFNLEKPNPLLLKQHRNLANPIYDATKCKEAGGTDDPLAIKFLQNESAGFGPYRLSQMVRGQQAVFTARDDYWGEKPFMKTVIMREVPTSAARLSLLRGGAVDIAQFLQPREYISIKDDPNITFDSVNSSYMIWLELNSKIPPFDNIKVRQAMNYAMPRDEIIRTVYYDQADPLTAPMPYIYPDATSDFFNYGYDLAKAKALLAEAGFKDGFSTTISYNAGDPTQEPISLLYQSSLREIGVNITLEKLPAGVFYENVTKRAKPMIFYLDSPWTADPGYSTFLYFHTKSYVNYSNYENLKVNQLIESGLETLDPGVRTATYREVQKILMEEAPWCYIAYPKYTMARKRSIKGLTYYTSNNLRFQDFTRV